MSESVYGIVDKEKDIILSFQYPSEGLFYAAYESRNLLDELDEEFCNEFSFEDENAEENWKLFVNKYFPKTDINTYAYLSNKINLSDINFNEKSWQYIMMFFDSSFFSENLCLVSVEQSNEGSDQKVDLLYLQSDGKILPAEIKTSNNGRDVHGQIIRYIAGFHGENFTIDKILKMAKRKIPENIGNINDFIKKNNINENKIELLEKTGLVICENFHNDTTIAIKYLKEIASINIKMFRIELFVEEEWDKEINRFIYRIDLNEIL